MNKRGVFACRDTGNRACDEKPIILNYENCETIIESGDKRRKLHFDSRELEICTSNSEHLFRGRNELPRCGNSKS